MAGGWQGKCCDTDYYLGLYGEPGLGIRCGLNLNFELVLLNGNIRVFGRVASDGVVKTDPPDTDIDASSRTSIEARIRNSSTITSMSGRQPNIERMDGTMGIQVET
jgi:hypothetical protein